ncbi:hypothetical protein [Balneatrix alpica]|uniref:Uncharacterized protein n=1 Tax=Balneatrix alpica TaxID=75684 RepID=A0ABV5ZDI4_9GAMM|nr:hypothetical protein [Balneatrix alpica]
MKKIQIKLSCKGRDDDLHRLDMYDVPLLLHGFWSMHHAQGGEGKAEFRAKRVVSAKGILKRYLMEKILIKNANKQD